MNTATAALADSLVGAWTLVSYATADTDGGDTEHPLGADAHGVIIYTADGFMSVQISSSGRPVYNDEALHGGSPSERAAAAAGYIAYAGTYSVADDVVTHQPTASLFPNWENADVSRRARITGDTLTLDLVEPILKDGRERTGTLTWRRAPRHRI
jgi:hypothetical protein